MTTYLASLNSALNELLSTDSKVLLIGEDIADPYGGAFKVSKGLSSHYPAQVFTTPISEAGLTGLCAGMSLRGYKPILEIMFGDFLTLCMDQILNHIVKFQGMYQLEMPPKVVLRTPMGGGRGYGPTHSQSIEKHFFGIPGLQIMAPSHWHNPGTMLIRAVTRIPGPVLFIENKLLYGMALNATPAGINISAHVDGLGSEIIEARNYENGRPDITILAYGGLSRLLQTLLTHCLEDEIKIKALLPATIHPLPSAAITRLCADSSLLMIAEEGNAGFNWGSEMASVLYENMGHKLLKPIKRLASAAAIIPTAKHQEEAILISMATLENAVEELLS